MRLCRKEKGGCCSFINLTDEKGSPVFYREKDARIKIGILQRPPPSRLLGSDRLGSDWRSLYAAAQTLSREHAKEQAMNLGLLLPNQGVVFGATTVPELLELAEQAEGSGAFESLWVGDNLLAKPRLESVTLLSALAARTKRCRLGTACMASFPLRNPIILAAQWGALDCLADGRTVLTACIGGGGAKGLIAGGFDAEYDAMQINPRERVARMEEGIEVLRVLWTEDPASFEGRFFSFQRDCGAPRSQCRNRVLRSGLRTTRGCLVPRIRVRTASRWNRVARLADGWMTVGATPKQFSMAWQEILNRHRCPWQRARADGKIPCTSTSTSTTTVQPPYTESKRFLDEYYRSDWPEWKVNLWDRLRCARGVCGAAVRVRCRRRANADHPLPLLRPEGDSSRAFSLRSHRSFDRGR